MPPRIPIRSRPLRLVSSNSHSPACQVRLASVAAVQSVGYNASSPIERYPSTQPPSHRAPSQRKSQLHRQYQSLLQTSPLILIFQHNNLTAGEWANIRIQLYEALQKVDDANPEQAVAKATKLQVIQTSIFEAALKVVEFWDKPAAPGKTIHPTDPSVDSSRPLHTASNHGLSRAAWRHSNRAAKTKRHGLEALLSGPLMLVSFPSTSPAHVAAALRILSPGDKFPAPKRKVNPAYHAPKTQKGLQKLMLLGARIEGKAMDTEGVRWVGGIEGGLTGLRAQLVGLLSSAGMGLANVLEGAGRSLYITMEGRKMDMEKGETKEEGPHEGAGAAAPEETKQDVSP